MSKYTQYAIAEAVRQGVDPNLVLRVMQQESGGKQDSVSTRGARGLMQLMPATAKELGVDVNDPYQNIKGGITYLKQQITKFGDVPTAIAAYNAGPGAVQRSGGVPPYKETQQYMGNVMGNNLGSGADIFGMGVTTKQAKGSRSGSDIFGMTDDMKPIQRTAPAPQKPQSQAAQSNGVPLTWWDRYSRGAKEIGEGIQQRIMHTVSGLEGNPLTMPAAIAVNLVTKPNTGVITPGTTAQYDSDLSQVMRKYDKDIRSQIGSDIDWPRLLGTATMTAPTFLIPGANTLKGSAIIGSMLGAIQPIDTTKGDYSGQTFGNALGGAGGGLAGYGLGSLIGKVIRPLSVATRPGLDTGIDAANNLGVQLTTGQRVGSLGLQQFENALARMPGATGRMNKIISSNKDAINQAAAKSIGSDANALSEDVLDSAKSSMQNEYGRLFGGDMRVKLGPDFVQAMQGIGARNAELGPFANDEISAQVQHGLDLAGKGDMSGSAYQTLRSRLGKRANALLGGNSSNPEVGIALNEIQSALDDAASGSLSAEDQGALRNLQQQWGNYKTLTKSNVVTNGDVNPTQVGIALKQYSRDAYKRGALDTPLMDIARYGEAFKSQVPNSGTPERGLIYSALHAPLLHGALVGGSNLLQAGMENPVFEYWMKNGLLPNNPIGNGLLRVGIAPIAPLGEAIGSGTNK